MPVRDLIFVSHANPEDNRFSRWLSLRLAREGYKVWCDLTRLLGGEDFWKDIEKALRTRTIKYVYVLSRTSNSKDGPLNELAVARQVARSGAFDDFIIPVRIDDLPTSDINIELKRLNAIPFNGQWATGFAQLLDKLQSVGISKNSLSGPHIVGDWWKKHGLAGRGATTNTESYFSNLFPISFPQSIYVHRLEQPQGEWRLGGENPPPASLIGASLFSFAASSEFRGRLPYPNHIIESRQVAFDEFLRGTITIRDDSQLHRGEKRFPRQQARNVLVDLIQQAVRKTYQNQGLILYELSSRPPSFYFPSSLVPEDTLRVDKLRIRRQVVGYRTVSLPTRTTITYWHFALSGRLVFSPNLLWATSTHVLFSDDGKRVWNDAARLHRARRRYCRNWWNDKWRDLLLCSMSWLGGGGERITIPLSGHANALIASTPVSFRSPVSYTDPSVFIEHEWEYDEDDDDPSALEGTASDRISPAE